MYKKSELIFIYADGFSLKISKEPLQTMLSFRQMEKGSHESGGVLLGRHIIDSSDVVVDFVTTPQKNDNSTETFFFKNKEEHQEIINTEWKMSKGTCNYIGEWHTHPQDHPIPSLTDMKTWLRLVKETKFEFGELFFIIVGRESVCAYLVNQKIYRLKLINE